MILFDTPGYAETDDGMFLQWNSESSLAHSVAKFQAMIIEIKKKDVDIYE